MPLRQQVVAVDKRVDDQLAQMGQAVDRFGVTTTWIGAGICGFLGTYRIDLAIEMYARSPSSPLLPKLNSAPKNGSMTMQSRCENKSLR